MSDSAAALLDQLDPDQRAVAEQFLGPVCVLAGAGTGKTRAITYRIAYAAATGAIDPANVLAVTFTARAASEMLGRLQELGVHRASARTFHAAALRQLSYFWPTAVGGEIPPLLEHKGSLVATAASRLGMPADSAAVRDLAAEVEWAKVSLIRPSEYTQAANNARRTAPAEQEYGQIAELLSLYEEVKRERGVIDMEDILILTAGVLKEREDIAAQVRRQYQYFVVDEYQDVSPVQQYLLDTWVGGRQHLCVVGDVAQTIYSFAGASPRYLTGFKQKYPHATVIELTRDYRSTPQVVSLANRIINGPESGQAGAVTLRAQRPSGPAARFSCHGDDQAEAEAVATEIAALISQGTSPGQIAILYRTNTQSAAFEEALSARGIAFLVRGGKQFFSREEVRQALIRLRASATGPEIASLPWIDRVKDELGSLGWAATAPTGAGARRERWESLQALIELAEQHANTGGDIRSYVAELMRRSASQHAPTSAGVTLSSLHAAKGLEWDAVFLVGMSEGLLPISLAENLANIAEERRLLYVGITRAREHLALSYALARHPGGRAIRKVSRFLTPLWPAAEVQGQRRAQQKEDAKVAAARFAAEQEAEVLELFSRLRSWRLQRAQQAGKPAFTILTDVSLREIAINKPQTLEQLSEVRGIGQLKLAEYGTEVLEIVRN